MAKEFDDGRSVRRVRPQFERRQEEDRSKTDENGRYMTKGVDYVILTVIGDARNHLAMPVDEWLTKCQKQAFDGEIPQDWVDYYKSAYKRFSEGASIDEITDGTPLASWPLIGAAHVEMCLQRNVRTVEELAALDEGVRKFFGPGIVSLQNKAKTWLESSGALARENQELRDRVERVEQMLKLLGAA